MYTYDGYTRLWEFDDGRGFDNYFDSARSKNYQKCYLIHLGKVDIVHDYKVYKGVKAPMRSLRRRKNAMLEGIINTYLFFSFKKKTCFI